MEPDAAANALAVTAVDAAADEVKVEAPTEAADAAVNVFVSEATEAEEVRLLVIVVATPVTVVVSAVTGVDVEVGGATAMVVVPAADEVAPFKVSGSVTA